jgi:hypothetical protein
MAEKAATGGSQRLKQTTEEPALPATGGSQRLKQTTEEPALPATGGSRRLKQTIDHGEIIHFAGRLRLFPVVLKSDALRIRLAARDDVQEGEVRVGWPAYFRPFIDRRLVFLYDEAGGQAVTRAEARAALAQGSAGPAGAASTA